MKEHWNEMLNKYPDNSISRMCEGIIGLVTPELEADVRKFFSEHRGEAGSEANGTAPGKTAHRRRVQGALEGFAAGIKSARSDGRLTVLNSVRPEASTSSRLKLEAFEPSCC